MDEKIILKLKEINSELDLAIKGRVNYEKLDKIYNSKYFPFLYENFGFLLKENKMIFYGEIIDLKDINLKNAIIYIAKIFQEKPQEKELYLKKIIQFYLQESKNKESGD